LEKNVDRIVKGGWAMKKMNPAIAAVNSFSPRRRLVNLLLVLFVEASGTALGQNPSACRVNLPACGVKCGSNRWTLKTLSDVDAGKVDSVSIQKKTVANLTALPKPSKRPKCNRVAPTEMQTFEVEANLTEIGTEKDKDFHMVIADLGDPSKTMIVEIPDSACQGACASKHFKDFMDARTVFIAHCGAPTKNFKQVEPPVKVTVTGVGFFDPPRHGTGAANNGIELHPVLKIEFDPDNDDCRTRAK
jgi:hypothetical protein